MRPEDQEPTLDKHGNETHPAFGFINAHRISSSPGAVLFDSDIKHGYFVRVTISTATRKRDLNQDWMYAGRMLVEVDMSEAQWASFVSSMNTSGVPCTLSRTESGDRPGLTYAPRLAESMKEVHGAADKAFDKIKAAMAVYEHLVNTKAGAVERREALRVLHYTIENATSNVDFAGRTLVEHAENVVQRSRADIEAMVLSHADRLGIDRADLGQILELE